MKSYDTPQTKDPATGLPPVKARVKQRHDQNGTSRTVEQTAAAATAESDTTLEYEGGELNEVTVTATEASSLWERMKQGAAWAAAIMILAAAGWIIYKFKKANDAGSKNKKKQLPPMRGAEQQTGQQPEPAESPRQRKPERVKTQGESQERGGERHKRPQS